MSLKLPKLNLADYTPKIKLENDTYKIFDFIRKKWIILTPEEWVRQNFINHLISELNYPVGQIAVEFQIKYGNLSRRPDIVVFDKMKNPFVIVECKAPSIEINEDVFYQACMYNNKLNAKYFFLTNGLTHIITFLDLSSKEITFIQDIPDYQNILKSIS